MKFQTQWDKRERTPEKNSGISQTVPDQSMSIRQIMMNHTVDSYVETFNAKYHDETGQDEEAVGFETGEIMERLDYADIQERAQALADRQEERNAIDERNKKEKKKKDLQKIFEKHEQEIRDRIKNEQTNNGVS